MRLLPNGLADHLESGTTTLCWCWRLTRRDGETLGFTDHDRDLSFDGTTFEAASGMTATELKDTVGLSVDNLEVDGAITSELMRENDLAAGHYDGAHVEIFRVNWSDVDQRVLMRRGKLGEVTRTQSAFTAEVRGLSQELQQPRGRVFQYTCDAVLGDARCGVSLDQPSYRASATVIAVIETATVKVSLADVFDDGWFTRGTARSTSGSNADATFAIKQHVADGTNATVTLWTEPVHGIEIGDTFLLTAGCDKYLDTCASKFTNHENFRGFPFMPGNDVLTRVGRS